MVENYNDFYKDINLPEELLCSFVKAMAPEIREFYRSKDGQSYYEQWLLRQNKN